MKKNHFPDVDSMVAQLQPGYPVYCLRPEELKRRARLFLDNFPGRVLYAVKCNPNLTVLKALYEAGIRHFDTASLAEIALIRENFPDADCYFMHPVKSRSAIMSASKVYRVDHYVIDHEAELKKLVEVTGGGDGQVVLVRIKTPQFDAMYKLADKFGATPEEAVPLLRQVVKEGFQTGIAFHVGSQCRSPEAYREAIRIVGEVAEKAGVNIHYVDVGGGFPIPYVEDIPDDLTVYFDAIRDAIKSIKLRGDTVLMCEPGRSMVGTGASLVVQVHLRKGDMLYINDGVYHSLNETMTSTIKLPMRVIRPNQRVSKNIAEFTVFGPTCDSTDMIGYRVALPDDVREGDWIEIGQAGAYTNSMTTAFNGFHPETFVTVDQSPLTPNDVYVVSDKSKAASKSASDVAANAKEKNTA